VAPQIEKIRAGSVEETNFRQVVIGSRRALETVWLGIKYRTEMQGNNERITIHELSHLFEKPVPKEFQDSARELYESIEHTGA